MQCEMKMYLIVYAYVYFICSFFNPVVLDGNVLLFQWNNRLVLWHMLDFLDTTPFFDGSVSYNPQPMNKTKSLPLFSYPFHLDIRNDLYVIKLINKIKSQYKSQNSHIYW